MQPIAFCMRRAKISAFSSQENPAPAKRKVSYHMVYTLTLIYKKIKTKNIDYGHSMKKISIQTLKWALIIKSDQTFIYLIIFHAFLHRYFHKQPQNTFSSTWLQHLTIPQRWNTSKNASFEVIQFLKRSEMPKQIEMTTRQDSANIWTSSLIFP